MEVAVVAVRLLKPWGSFVQGDVADVPQDLADNLVGNGVAELAGEPAKAAKVERAVQPLPEKRTADAKL
jgi:hypothetical protein